jgi:hypothetical protein
VAGGLPMGTFKSISIFAYDLDQRGNPVQAWETVVDESEEDVGEEGDPIIVFQSGGFGAFD